MGVKRETEKGFMGAVVAMARLHGWRVYHTHDSRRSAPGFPDLVLVRGDRLLFVELKLDGGKLSPEQVAWLDALRAAGQDAGVWRPRDWAVIERALSGRTEGEGGR